MRFYIYDNRAGRMIVDEHVADHHKLNLEWRAKRAMRRILGGPTSIGFKCSFDRMTGIGDYDIAFSEEPPTEEGFIPFHVWESKSMWVEVLPD